MRTLQPNPVIGSAEQLAEAMKREILALIESGKLPSDIDSFSRLHDHCDANCLGGLCDATTLPSLVEQFGGYGPENELPQKMINLVNAAQETVNDWLQHGRRP